MANTEEIKILLVSEDATFWAPQLKETRLPLKVQIANKVEVFKFLIQEWTPDICLIDSDTISAKALTSALNPRKKFTTITLLKSAQIKQKRAYTQAGSEHVLSHEEAESFLRDILINLKLKYSLQEGPRHYTEDEEPVVIKWQDLRIYPNDYLVKIDDRIINTSPVQFRLLLSLINNHDQLLSRQWLQQYVWHGNEISPRSIDAQISKLKKLVPIISSHLLNIYGKGYILSSAKKNVA